VTTFANVTADARVDSLKKQLSSYSEEKARIEDKLREIRKLIAVAKGNRISEEMDSRTEELNKTKADLQKEMSRIKRKIDDIEIELRQRKRGVT
jgi:uncharacterized protein (DUF342 family)